MRFDTRRTRVLIASAPFGELGTEQVAAAIARGLAGSGMPDPDVSGTRR